MEQLEAKTKEFVGRIEIRCKGWCHSKTEMTYQIELPDVKYFN